MRLRRGDHSRADAAAERKDTKLWMFACVIMENLKQCEGTSVKLLELTKKRRIASNTSGYTGVYRRKGSEKWFAQITFQRRTYYLGGYERLEDVIKARQTGERMHDDFLNWYYGRRPDAEVKD